MKKLLIILVASIAFCSSCKESEDYEAQFVKTWASYSYKNNGLQISAQKQDALDLKSDMTFSRTVITRDPLTLDVSSTVHTAGNWSANKDRQTLTLDADKDVTMAIKSIDATALVVGFTESGIAVEVEFR